MRVFAIADLHLPGAYGKLMDVFGVHWHEHPKRIAADWDSRVRDEDIVLLPGDISWAMKLSEAEADLSWIGERPGTKVMIRGNHDYWWSSIGKVRRALPAKCHAIQNDAWVSHDGRIGVAGARMWDLPGLALGDIFAPQPGPRTPVKVSKVDPEEQATIFQRELGRLELSLQQIPDRVETRIAIVHYPPTAPSLSDTIVTDLLERYSVNLCLFGHLHNVREGTSFSGMKNGIRFELVSADFLDFKLIAM